MYINLPINSFATISNRFCKIVSGIQNGLLFWKVYSNKISRRAFFFIPQAILWRQNRMSSNKSRCCQCAIQMAKSIHITRTRTHTHIHAWVRCMYIKIRNDKMLGLNLYLSDLAEIVGFWIAIFSMQKLLSFALHLTDSPALSLRCCSSHSFFGPCFSSK